MRHLSDLLPVPRKATAALQGSPVKAGVVLVLAVLVLNGAVSYLSVRQLLDDERQSARAREVLTELEALQAAVADAETGQRGYLLTGEDSYLEPYRAALSAIPERSRRLRELAEDDPLQAGRLDRLEQQVNGKLRELQATIDLRREQGPEAALRVVFTDRGREEMDAIRRTAAEIREVQQETLRRRAGEFHTSARVALLAFGVVTILALALLGLFSALFRRYLRERQEADRALGHQLEWLRVTLLSIGDALIVTDDQARITLMNPAAEALTGWPQREAAGKPLDNVLALIHEDTREPIASLAPRVLQEGVVAGPAGDTVLVTRDGDERPIEDCAAAIRDDRGHVLGSVVVFHDVSERRQAGEARARLAAIVESSEDAIFSVTLEGTITTWNAGAEHLTGYAAGEVVGRPVTLFLPADRAGEMTRIREEIARGGHVKAHDTVWLRKDGRPVDVSLSVSPIRDAARRVAGASAIARDLTEQKRLEQQLRQGQKMEAIGRLAGGVAHDFNNLLTVISGCSELLLARLGPGDPPRDLLLEIKKAGERATTLTRQLLAFSRRQVLSPRVVDLNGLLGETDKLLRRLIGEDIDLVTSLAPGLYPVKVDPSQVEQVLMNLAVNARDAMPQGGSLTIETANIELDESYTRTRPEVKPGAYVMLAVSDTGVGMDAETRARIFEPFFTTKEPGKGTGLGLATVYGIVKQSGGYVYVYSEPGRGTSFKIYLPRSEEGPEDATPRETPVRPRGGTETVLLVEDEAGVRALARRVLEAAGYTVVEAHDGAEALRLAERRLGPIHLLLTDVVMPQVSGRRLADQLTALRPALKLLFLSGYTDEAIVHHRVLDPRVAFLQKPFTPDALLRKVRSVLDQSIVD